MFTKKIIDSDAFLDMPLSTQCLYFHLNMRADDDGFVNNPKKISRMIGASEDDLKLLITKRFVLVFDTGVIVIKHWRMHNLIKKDRYHATDYQEEYAQLIQKSNGAYTEKPLQLPEIPVPEQNGYDVEPSWNPNGTQMEPEWNQNGTQMEPQVRLGKDSIGKDRLGEDKIIDSKESIRQTDVRRAVEEWNKLSSFGIKPVTKLTANTKRHEMLVARIKQYGIDDVLSGIEHIKYSDFLQGKKTNFIITFDWFVKPNNFPKVLEGNYDNNNYGGDGSSMSAEEIMKDW